MRSPYVPLGIILALLGTFLFLPIASSLAGMLWIDQRLSAQALLTASTSPLYQRLALTSLNLALATTLATLVLALPCGWWLARKKFFAKSSLSFLLILPLFLPPFAGLLGFRQMTGRFGVLNSLLLELGIITAPIDLLGGAPLIGIVIVQTLHLFPIPILALQAAFSKIDPNLEEAARISGASSSQIFRRVYLPLATPTLVLTGSLIFVASFTDLGTPLLFEYREVLPVYLFNLLSDTRQNPVGDALVNIIALLSILLFIVPKLIIDERRYATAAPTRVRLLDPCSGILRFVIPLGLLSLGLIALMPYVGVVLVSLSDRWFMSILPERWTFDHYRTVFSHPLTLVSMRNSMFLSIAATVVCALISMVSVWLIVRTKVRGRSLLDGLLTLPLAIPGIVLAFGYVRAFAGTALDPRVNPLPLLIMAYAIRKLPLMVRNVHAGFLQVHPSLEEAARVSGATSLTAIRRITLPLILPFLLAGCILTFSGSMFEVSDSLILAMEDRFSPVAKALYTLTGRPDGPPLACALSMIVVCFLSILLWIGARLSGRPFSEMMRTQ